MHAFFVHVQYIHVDTMTFVFTAPFISIFMFKYLFMSGLLFKSIYSMGNVYVVMISISIFSVSSYTSLKRYIQVTSYILSLYSCILPLITLSRVSSIAVFRAVLTLWLQYIVLLRFVRRRVAIPSRLWQDCRFRRLGRW